MTYQKTLMLACVIHLYKLHVHFFVHLLRELEVFRARLVVENTANDRHCHDSYQFQGVFVRPTYVGNRNIENGERTVCDKQKQMF